MNISLGNGRRTGGRIHGGRRGWIVRVAGVWFMVLMGSAARSFASPAPPENPPLKLNAYALECYQRMGITAAEFENTVGAVIDCKTVSAGSVTKQLYTTKDCPYPNDFSKTPRQPGCTVLDIEVLVGKCTGDRNKECFEDFDCRRQDVAPPCIDFTFKPNPDPNRARGFPTDCDRPVWNPDSEKCYGNSYIRKWNITATRPRPGKSKVTIALICRHKSTWSDANDTFDNIAMIMHNNDNGETCWFQSPTNAANLDGMKVPAPHVAPTKALWQKPSDAAADNCIKCHDNGPWMNSRWMFNSQRLEERVDRREPYLVDGKEPYINAGDGFSAWKKPKFITVDTIGLGHDYDLKDKSCTSCHRIDSGAAGGDGQSIKNWIKYTVGSTVQLDPSGNKVYPPQSNATGQDRQIAYWMAPEAHLGLADVYAGDEVDWGEIYKKHVDELLACCKKKGVPDPTVKGDPCKTVKVAAAPATPSPTPGVHLTAVTCDDDVCVPYDSTDRDLRQPIVVPTDTLLSVHWSADADHLNCFIATTFPPGVEVINDAGTVTGTGTNWLLSEDQQEIGKLTVPGDYFFHIACNDEAEVQLYRQLIFQVPGQPPTILRIQGIVNGVGTTAVKYVNYPGCPGPNCPVVDRPHVDITVGTSSDVIIAWAAFNVVAGTCELIETLLNPTTGDPTGDMPLSFPDESGFMSVSLYVRTHQNYRLTCMGKDRLTHSVDVTLRVGGVVPAMGSVAWIGLLLLGILSGIAIKFGRRRGHPGN